MLRFDIHEGSDDVFAGIYDGHGGSKVRWIAWL
jgi:serine/threonine protein phosphatase PrpC